MVDPSTPQSDSPGRRMLSPDDAQSRKTWRFPARESGQAPAPTETIESTSPPQAPLPARPKTRTSDSTPLLLATLLLVGLLALSLGVWFIVAQQVSDLPARSTGPNPLQIGSKRLLAEAQATRDAQGVEIAVLREQLHLTRQELATVIAQPSPTPIPGSTHLDQPPLALILDVPIFKQERSLSCESSAAAMTANFHSVQISEKAVLDSLPRHENPNLGFRGDVDGPHGQLGDYGVYAGPIDDALTQLGLQVQPLDGGLPEIKEHIRQGRPVIVWITYGMENQTPRPVSMSDGQTVTLVPFEHVVVAIGYNADGLWVNDPYAGTQDFYAAADFRRSFAYLGNMGLAVGPSGGAQPDAQ